MSEPRFGNCRDCACWENPRPASIYRDTPLVGVCVRHPEPYHPHEDHGCWDHIPKTEDRHV